MKRRNFLQSIPRRQLIQNGIFGLLLLLALMRHFRVTVFLQRGHIPGDFAIIWTAGLAAQRGIDMYEPQAARELALAAVGEVRSGWYSVPLWSTTHPPSEFPLTWLFALLPWSVAASIWLVFLQFCFFATLGWLLVLLRRHRASLNAQWIFGILGVLFIPAQFSIEIGQLDLPLLALILAALALAQRGHSGRAGIAIGIAACIKPTPVILLGLFLLRKDWRAIVGACLTALFLIYLSILLVGFESWATWLSRILPELLKGSTLASNQSFNGIGFHLFAAPELLHSLAPPPSIASARALTLILSIGFLGVLATIAWRFGRETADWRFQIVYALFVVYMLIGSSISWDYYYTWALLPLALLLAPRAGLLRTRRDWIWMIVYLGAYGLIALPARFYVFDPSLYRQYLILRLLIPVHVYGALLLSGLLIRALWLNRFDEIKRESICGICVSLEGKDPLK